MRTRAVGVLALGLALGACSGKKDAPAGAAPGSGSGSGSGSATAPHAGHLVVAVTIDWEGAYLSPEGLDALDEVRRALGSAPLTHFVCAGYFTKAKPDPTAVTELVKAVHPGDEVAVHVHGWRSLAKASGIEPKLTPSFLSGAGKLLEFEDGDVGFDLDLDAYSVPELRAILRTSRQLLTAQTKLPLSTSFRAGGYLGTPKVLQAIHEEGFTVDSSATDYRQLDDERKGELLPKRLHEIWPTVDSGTQPFVVAADAPLLELPIAAFADYATADEIVTILEAAHARLVKAPDHDQFVVLGFHQETGGDFAARIREALGKVLANPQLAPEVTFVTVEQAAARARAATTR